jgi:hypothetical protein
LTILFFDIFTNERRFQRVDSSAHKSVVRTSYGDTRRFDKTVICLYRSAHLLKFLDFDPSPASGTAALHFNPPIIPLHLISSHLSVAGRGAACIATRAALKAAVFNGKAG